jgi:hypothetical protein
VGWRGQSQHFSKIEPSVVQEQALPLKTTEASQNTPVILNPLFAEK